ncbi:uncharacterized protein METZ01_LOCUS445761 [marine metagenome]|uniref:Uncharacterized protein n=1 Tax=marine metagenome TaxID=408172 RepID=A0A382ZBL2_9ZZZZ
MGKPRKLLCFKGFRHLTWQGASSIFPREEKWVNVVNSGVSLLEVGLVSRQDLMFRI